MGTRTMDPWTITYTRRVLGDRVTRISLTTWTVWQSRHSQRLCLLALSNRMGNVFESFQDRVHLFGCMRCRVVVGGCQWCSTFLLDGPGFFAGREKNYGLATKAMGASVTTTYHITNMTLNFTSAFSFRLSAVASGGFRAAASSSDVTALSSNFVL
jgi:hypothetical protein